MVGGKLTDSPIDRQNILSNSYALLEIKKATNIQGIPFMGTTVLLKDQVAEFFEVTSRTIDNYLGKYGTELAQNGYAVLKGKALKKLKLSIKEQDVHEIDFVNISKSPQLGVFDFRAFLNLGMLITESNRARMLRQLVLDIVIDTINKKTGGGTKYINQRDEDFLQSWFSEENYRKQFTGALKDCVDMGNFKYAIYTDKIYLSIFLEQAKEYRKVLKLHEKDKIRDTMYSEVLDIVAAYECGFGAKLSEECQARGRKLSSSEVDHLFREFGALPLWKPLVEKARNKMASRDLVFRDALHHHLKEYVTPIEASEFGIWGRS